MDYKVDYTEELLEWASLKQNLEAFDLPQEKATANAYFDFIKEGLIPPNLSKAVRLKLIKTLESRV